MQQVSLSAKSELRRSAGPNCSRTLLLAMRILQVSSAKNWGGGETHVAQLVASLRKRGHDVVVAGRPNGPIKARIELPFLNSVDFITAIRLRNVLQREPFDIIHAHVARDYTIVAAAAWTISQPKVVFT